jgi:hypothetical protein
MIVNIKTGHSMEVY